ncbi:MAG: hypothetical protein ACK5Q5_18015 [Planctomycetaceae bacterium]
MAAPMTSGSKSSIDPASVAEQLASMAAELQQRDQLIEALTERLEEAAEQLDRIHRSGGDRGVRNSGGGTTMPAEALEYLYGVAERTDQMVADWVDLETPQLLSRLDARIEALMDILRGDAPQQASGYTPPSFLGGQSETPAPATTSTISSTAADEPAEDAVPDVEIELKDPPEAVSDDEVDPARLRAAIFAREDYISYLIRELHRRHPRQPIDWTALEAAPAEYVERLKQLETRLHSELQKEELNLSLERAKMARERVELDKIRARLERDIRSLNGSAKPAAPVPQEKEDTTGSLRKLFARKK